MRKRSAGRKLSQRYFSQRKSHRTVIEPRPLPWEVGEHLCCDMALGRLQWAVEGSSLSCESSVLHLSLRSSRCLTQSSFTRWSPCAPNGGILGSGDCECSYSVIGCFIPRERAPGTSWVGGWMDPLSWKREMSHATAGIWTPIPQLFTTWSLYWLRNRCSVSV
jgi:hypothetical protein